MRPVRIDGLPGKNHLLFLNISKLSLRYVTQLLTRGSANIRTKGGIALPNELWAMILNFGREGREDRFWLVKADFVAVSPNTALLRCIRHEFDRPENTNELVAGDLQDKESVSEFEKYLVSARDDELGFELPDLNCLSGPGNTFDVVLDTTSTDPCLFFFDVPEFIAIVDGGKCWFCNGLRVLCPGCTGGKAESFDFGRMLGCGVDIACPLCMGIEFSEDHERFLGAYFNRQAPEDEAKDMLKLLEGRLEELGYTDVSLSDCAWKGGDCLE
ncbi:hypothetical protein F4820DRAFT_171683 [Hypoxylon rubiginosum]|uniref:Uncharacterized protein n=1 Tax=Hypoxylon rubiginosum TaxID=110542 RepID=A0ACB9Z9L0_9PEZI|nr:hypothetical protein F4820DRAFT_171683 [Hypoxylon rubiginosum]